MEHPLQRFQGLRKRAISLIEGVLYLVVALAVIIGGIVFFQQSQLSNNVTDTARAAVGISSQARALYQHQTGFGDNEDLTVAMVRAGAVPSNFIDGTGDGISHPFGGGVTVTGNGSGFVISYRDISQAACIRLASIDPTGAGPMGTGMVGLTLSQGDPVDPTVGPEVTGEVKAETIAASCADGTEMAVYYAQNPGAKYVEADGGAGEPEPTPEPTPEPEPEPEPELSSYAQACSTGARSMEVNDLIYKDSSNNRVHTQNAYLLTPRTWTLNFGVTYEQEVYAKGAEQPDGRVLYNASHIFPPRWDPCVAEGNFPPPNVS